jgi:hypothetical protein
MNGPYAVPRYFQWVAVAPKMGKRLGGFLLSQAGLNLGVDSNCSGGPEKRLGCVTKLQNRIKPKFLRGYVSKVRRLLNAGEIVVPTFQTSGLACLQGNGNSRLLGATGRRGQPGSTVNSLKTVRNPVYGLSPVSCFSFLFILGVLCSEAPRNERLVLRFNPSKHRS